MNTQGEKDRRSETGLNITVKCGTHRFNVCGKWAAHLHKKGGVGWSWHGGDGRRDNHRGEEEVD